MTVKKVIKIDEYLLGWDQFLHAAYAFAKNDRWEMFEQIIPIYQGKPFDPTVFSGNLRKLVEFSQFDYPETVPLELLRDIPITHTWAGFINVGMNRQAQDKAVDYINNRCDFGKLQGAMDYFFMHAPGESWRKDNTKDFGEQLPHRRPTDRGKMLVMAFENEDDLVLVKMSL